MFVLNATEETVNPERRNNTKTQKSNWIKRQKPTNIPKYPFT